MNSRALQDRSCVTFRTVAGLATLITTLFNIPNIKWMPYAQLFLAADPSLPQNEKTIGSGLQRLQVS